MYFNADQKAVYDDFSTWWAPTIPCLHEMLKTSLFEVEEEHVLASGQEDNPIYRITIRAKAVAPRARMGERYLLDPAYGHGFGNRLIDRVPFDESSSPFSLQSYYKKLFPDRNLG
jgi:hypothetical protein